MNLEKDLCLNLYDEELSLFTIHTRGILSLSSSSKGFDRSPSRPLSDDYRTKIDRHDEAVIKKRHVRCDNNKHYGGQDSTLK